jgi:hypothetical protein
MAIKYINIFKCWALQKFSKIWIFGLKINHLATLVKMQLRNEPDECGRAPAATGGQGWSQSKAGIDLKNQFRP